VKPEGSQPLPVGVYFHGGGWCCGDLDTEDPFCQLIAEHLPCIIVSVNYRLAPEYKSPTQLEDALTGWNWVRKFLSNDCSDPADSFQALGNVSELNGDIKKCFVIGQSAGGHLALALANKLINLNRQGEVRGIAALVPITAHPDHIPAQYADNYRSFKHCANAPMNSTRAMLEFFGLCSSYEHV
jgi:versiconal hemiacetal acetate esterase